MKSIKEAGNLSGKRVLVRVDWNGFSQFRVERSLPTIKHLIESGARVVAATHLEPEGASVEPLHKLLPSGVELLENLRNSPGEKANSEEFAAFLASLADIYVNEAFSASHREHASIVGVPRLLPSYAGLNFMEEVEKLSKSFNPPHPFLLILGGAKFDTKLPLVKKFLDIADKIFVLGANAKPVSESDLAQNPKISLPFGDPSALDANDETIANCKLEIENAKFILWNGPLGKYEDGYTEGTEKLAKILAESNKEVVVGGADTLEVVGKLGLLNNFSFVSTGGGAMLDFLASGTLPGIKALKS